MSRARRTSLERRRRAVCRSSQRVYDIGFEYRSNRFVKTHFARRCAVAFRSDLIRPKFSSYTAATRRRDTDVYSRQFRPPARVCFKVRLH